MKSLEPLYVTILLLLVVFVYATDDDPIFLKGHCSGSDVYCEDLFDTNATGNIYEIMTNSTDISDPTNFTTYEHLS